MTELELEELTLVQNLLGSFTDAAAVKTIKDIPTLSRCIWNGCEQRHRRPKLLGINFAQYAFWVTAVVN